MEFGFSMQLRTDAHANRLKFLKQRYYSTYSEYLKLSELMRSWNLLRMIVQIYTLIEKFHRNSLY